VSDQDRPGPQDPDNEHPGDEHPGDDRSQGPDIGSVGEEAAKLLGALSDWARDQSPDMGHGLGGLAGHAAASLREIGDHIATGSAECAYCPICRTVHMVRETSPEVRTHLVTAASSFLQAAAALLAAQVPQDEAGRASKVERIDLDDAPDDEEDGHEPGEA
jgi:hypothetical protein